MLEHINPQFSLSSERADALVARRYAESAGRAGTGGSIYQGWLKSCALLTSPPDGAGLCRVWLRERLAGCAAYRARSSAMTVSATAAHETIRNFVFGSGMKGTKEPNHAETQRTAHS